MTEDEIYMEPTKLADNLFFVGVKGGPCYLWVTNDGLVLIDTSLPDCAERICTNIRFLGYDVKDVKHIIHTHGHYDHIGSTKKLLEKCNAKTYIGRFDEDTVMGKNELLYLQESGVKFHDYFSPDVVVDDKTILDFGNVKMRFLSTAGHTQGTMSLFFDVFVEGKKYTAGMFGGSGLNTLTTDYLVKHDLSLSLRENFLDSIEKLKKEKVDFHVGNHMSEFHYYDKVKKLGEDVNPFLAENTYYAFLEQKEKEAKKLFLSERL